MARLFTTKPLKEDQENEIENQLESIDIKTSPNSRNMTVAPSIKSKSNAINLKLKGSWTKLIKLPPQELVSELKVINSHLFTLAIKLF